MRLVMQEATYNRRAKRRRHECYECRHRSTSYQVSDFGDAAHRSSTQTGAKLFIVD